MLKNLILKNKKDFNSNILKYCDFKYNTEDELYNKYFISIKLDEETIMFGDDGRSWVNEILKTNTKDLGEFKQGYSSIENTIILNDKKTKLNLEVYVNE